VAPWWWFLCKPKHVGAVLLILKCFNNSTFFNVMYISWKLKCWTGLLNAWRGYWSKSTWLSLVAVKQQYTCDTDRVVACILFHLQESIWLILTIHDFTKSVPVTLLPAWRLCVPYLSASDVVAVCQPCVYVTSCLWISSLCSSTCMMRS